MTEVIPSKLELPKSLEELITGDAGAAGAVVSMTMLLLAPNEPAAPGVGRVNVAAMAPEEEWMVPPLRLNAVVLNVSRSALVSPACTV